MKRLLFCLALTGVMYGQISLPAIVVDRTEQTVHGLQKSDFSVHCGKIATFESVDEVPSARLTGFGDPTPVFVLYDAVSIPLESQGQVANMLLEYLRRAAAERLPVTLLENEGEVVRVIHDLSTDSSVLASAIDRIAPKQPLSHVDSTNANSERTVDEEVDSLRYLTQLNYGYNRYGQLPEVQEIHQLTALQTIAGMLRQSDKRKLLVWITASFPLSVGPDELTHKPLFWEGKYQEEAITQYETATETLNKSRISVYPMRVLFPPSPKKGFDERSNVDGIGGIARATGGEVLGVLQNANDFANSMANLRKKADSYYMLSFSIQPPKKKSWVDTKVLATRSDTKVIAPKGFVAGQ